MILLKKEEKKTRETETECIGIMSTQQQNRAIKTNLEKKSIMMGYKKKT